MERLDIDLGIEWDSTEPLLVVALDAYGLEQSGWTTPLRTFEHIRSSLRFRGDVAELESQSREVALDAIDQAGLRFTSTFLTADSGR